MKNPDQRYDVLISRIKAATPEPDDPRKMTDNILSAIEAPPVKPRVRMVLYIGVWISSIAAISLILLFLSVYKTPLSGSETITCTVINTPYLHNVVIQTDTDKNDIISKVLVQRMNQRKKQRSLQNYVLMNRINN